MLSKNLATESRDEEEQPTRAAVSWRAVLNEVIRLTLYVVSGVGVSGIVLALVVLSILVPGRPPPPVPLPS